MFINSIHLLHSHRAGEFKSREIIYLALFSSFQNFLCFCARVHSPLNFCSWRVHVCVSKKEEAIKALGLPGC